MDKVKTRNVTVCPISGFPQDLKGTSLPTSREVMQGYLYEINELKPLVNSKEPTFNDIAKRLDVKLENIWDKASIPTVSHERILQLIRAYHDK